MQRHAFLIMAHNNWYTLQRLIQIIDAPWADIYLHIDRKARDFPKDFFLNLPKSATIRLTKRHSVTWGNESQVKAEMELFKTAYKRGPYHYYHFLSGSDLPLIDADTFYRYFEDKNCNFLYMDPDAAPYEWRLKTYINVFRSFPKFFRKRLNSLSEVVQHKLKVNRLTWLKVRYPILGKGTNWCDLTQRAIDILLQADGHIRKFTRFTQCSDEMYKPIILLNSPEDLSGPISNTNLRYIVCDETTNHPRTLTSNDYDSLMDSASSGFIYARKFDDRVDKVIIDQIHDYLMRKQFNCLQHN